MTLGADVCAAERTDVLENFEQGAVGLHRCYLIGSLSLVGQIRGCVSS